MAQNSKKDSHLILLRLILLFLLLDVALSLPSAHLTILPSNRQEVTFQLLVLYSPVCFLARWDLERTWCWPAWVMLTPSNWCAIWSGGKHLIKFGKAITLKNSQGPPRSPRARRWSHLLWTSPWANWSRAFHKTGDCFDCYGWFRCDHNFNLKVEEQDAGTYTCKATYATIQDIEAQVYEPKDKAEMKNIFPIKSRWKFLYLSASTGKTLRLNSLLLEELIIRWIFISHYNDQYQILFGK